MNIVKVPLPHRTHPYQELVNGLAEDIVAGVMADKPTHHVWTHQEVTQIALQAARIATMEGIFTGESMECGHTSLPVDEPEDQALGDLYDQVFSINDFHRGMIEGASIDRKGISNGNSD